jgi:hypothetical protein
VSNDQMRNLTILGAQTRLQQLRDEEAGLRAAFPQLFAVTGTPNQSRGRQARGRVGATTSAPTTSNDATGRTRSRGTGRSTNRPMSPATRKKLSQAAKQRWANRQTGVNAPIGG